jgi:D,D-heptose 1,7-bisphosphate phosphatase
MLGRIFTVMARAGPSPALFLDRDGVLNQRIEDGYVTDVTMLKVLDTTIPAIRLANQMGLPVVVVTNQGAVGRRLLTVSALDRINDQLRSALAEQRARLDCIYTCPHHPAAMATADRICTCRKPAPGLLLKAAAEMKIDLPTSVMVGDQPSDRGAAIAAGLPGDRVVILDGQFTPAKLEQRIAALLCRRAAWKPEHPVGTFRGSTGWSRAPSAFGGHR